MDCKEDWQQWRRKTVLVQVAWIKLEVWMKA